MNETLAKWGPRVSKSAAQHAPVLSLVAMALLVGLGLFLSMGPGDVQLTPAQILAVLLTKIHISSSTPFTPQQAAVLWTLRLPRALMAVLVGGALSAAGAAMQGLFRSALADPVLVGSSSGAALAILLVMALLGVQLDTFPGWIVVPVAGTLGAFGTLYAVYRLSHLRGSVLITTMILAGIGINALCGAAVGLISTAAHDGRLGDMAAWSLGGLGHTTWPTVAAVAPFILVACVLLPRGARALNAVLLGEVEARHLGFDVQHVQFLTMGLISLAVGTSVAAAGVIGFLGLIAPHLARQLVGSDHRLLLPGATFLGATLLLVADLLARTLATSTEVPLGVLTALLGAPFFLWLLAHERARAGV